MPLGSVGCAGGALPGTAVQPQDPSSHTLPKDQDRMGATLGPPSVVWTVLGVVRQWATPWADPVSETLRGCWLDAQSQSPRQGISCRHCRWAFQRAAPSSQAAQAQWSPWGITWSQRPRPLPRQQLPGRKGEAALRAETKHKRALGSQSPTTKAVEPQTHSTRHTAHGTWHTQG